MLNKILLCKVGSYPDKRLEITQFDLKIMVNTTELPIPLSMEFISTLFDYKCGHITKLDIIFDELYGYVTCPQFVLDVIEKPSVAVAVSKSSNRECVYS